MMIQRLLFARWAARTRAAVLVCFVAFLDCHPAQAAIYHCTGPGGTLVYSDAPCGADAEKVEVHPIAPAIGAATGTPNENPGANAAAATVRSVRISQCVQQRISAWTQEQRSLNGRIAEPVPVEDFRARCDALTPLTPPVQPPPLNPQGQSRLESFAIKCSTDDFNQWVKTQHPLPDWPIRRAKLFEISNRCRQAVHLPNLTDAPERAPSTPPQTRFPKDADFAQVINQGSVAALQTLLRTQSLTITDRSDLDKGLLDHAAEQNRVEAARYLIAQGVNVNAAQTRGPQNGTTALHRAAAANAYEVASLLVAAGATVNYHGPLGTTPLILASAAGSTRIVKLLLEHGADISTPTGDRKTALSEATDHQHPDIVQLLLVHIPTPDEGTLSTQASQANLEGIQLLLRHDALAHDVSADRKNIALRFAILGGIDKIPEREQIIALLLASGADINNTVNHAPNTPVMMTTSPQLAEFLVSHGASLNVEGAFGTAANQLACTNMPDRIGMFKVLLAHHADLTSPVTRGRNGVQCALESKDPVLIGFLRSQNVPLDSPPATPVPRSTFTNITTPGNLAATSPVKCGALAAMGNTHAPPDLYLGMRDCLDQGDFTRAADLFALAGMESMFDSQRVTDVSAGQARQVLLMTTLDGMPAPMRARLEATVRATHEDPKAMADLCSHIRRIGAPSYFPEYMVMHGIRAFTGDPHVNSLKTGFDAGGSWTNLQTSYLNCPQ